MFLMYIVLTLLLSFIYMLNMMIYIKKDNQEEVFLRYLRIYDI